VLNIPLNPNLKPYCRTSSICPSSIICAVGLISLAFFYKNVDNFIVNGRCSTRVVTRSDVVPSPDLPANAPIKLGDVKIKGVEFATSAARADTHFDSGLGLSATATYTDAPEFPPKRTACRSRLPGVSKYSLQRRRLF